MLMQPVLWRRRAAGAWTPASETGLVGWYEFDLANCWQDSGKTTAVTGNGDPVGYVEDFSGSGNHLTQSTSASRMTWKTGGFIYGDASADYILNNNLAVDWDMMNDTGYTCALLYEDPTAGGGTTAAHLCCAGGDTSNGIKFKQVSTTLRAEWYDGTNAVTTNQITGFFSQSTNKCPILWSDYGNDQVSCSADGITVDTDACATRITRLTVGISIGGTVGGNEFSSKSVRAAVFYNRDIGADARANLRSYMAAL